MNISEILPYFDSYKKAGGGRYQAACPMPDHNDSDPSVSVCQDAATGKILIFCWGCKRRGAELVRAMGLQTRDLFGDPGHPAAVNTDGFQATEVSAEDQAGLESYVEASRDNLSLAKDYILTRFGLSLATGQFLKLGYDANAFGSAPHLIVPFQDPSGKIVGMQGRRLAEGEPRWRSRSGGGWSKVGCFGWDLDGPVIITEGPSDALSVVGRAVLPAIGIRGASNTDDYVCQQIRDWLGDRAAIVIGDNDTAGEKFAQEIGDGVGIPSWKLPEGYSDIAEFLADGNVLDDAVKAAGVCPAQEPELSPAEIDEVLKRRVQDNLAEVIYDAELMAELRALPSGRVDLIFARIVEQAGHGQIGNTRNYLSAIRRELRNRSPGDHGDDAGHGGGLHAPPVDRPDPNLPEIIWNAEDQLHVTEHAIKLAMDTYDRGQFYRSATGQYVKVVGDELVSLKDPGVKSMLSQMGHWRVINGQREIGHVPSDASKLVSDPSWECGLPAIKRRVEVPFMLNDGEIVAATGFHEESGVYLLPRSGDFINVPEVPAIVTDEHVRQARMIFEDVTEGFLFKDQASKSNLIAMTLTSPLRELFRHNPMVPILTSTAPQSGSGKGTSIRLPLSTCGVGPHSLSTTAYNPDENEFEKKLVGKLLKKSTYIFLDNIRASVNSSVLEQMLTAANYDGRTLGYSEVNSLSTLVLWVSTLQSTGSFNRDLTRRCVPVELIKNYKGKWLHKNIDAYLSDMRGQMIWACFVVARKWLQDGGPTSEARLDGYGGWTEVIGGILEHVLGYEDFVGNLESFRKAQDETSMTIDGILERWLMMYGEDEHPARMAIEDYEDPALHQLLGLHNPSTRQVMNSLQRQLDSQRGHIIGNTHIWNPTGMHQYKHEGQLKLYRCEPLPLDDGVDDEE